MVVKIDVARLRKLIFLPAISADLGVQPYSHYIFAYLLSWFFCQCNIPNTLSSQVGLRIGVPHATKTANKEDP